MIHKQRDGYLTTEGDAWFVRNLAALNEGKSRSLISERISLHVKDSKACVLEVGCSRGDNLAALSKLCNIRAFGVDPSNAAIEAGLQSYLGFDLRCLTADALPFEDRSMDVVWFGFSMYVLDRELLSNCVMQANRVLKAGGLLCIHDFDPGYACVRSNHHAQDLLTYKMNYAELLLADPAYHLVEKISFSHSDIGWVADPQERLALWILRKNTEHAYPVG